MEPCRSFRRTHSVVIGIEPGEGRVDISDCGGVFFDVGFSLGNQLLIFNDKVADGIDALDEKCAPLKQNLGCAHRRVPKAPRGRLVKLQRTRGESVRETAPVLSHHVAAIGLRGPFGLVVSPGAQDG